LIKQLPYYGVGPIVARNYNRDAHEVKSSPCAVFAPHTKSNNSAPYHKVPPKLVSAKSTVLREVTLFISATTQLYWSERLALSGLEKTSQVPVIPKKPEEREAKHFLKS
jgi:hypothetical protein